MKYGLATMPRSGSEFVYKLVSLVLDKNHPEGVVVISPGRYISQSNSFQNKNIRIGESCEKNLLNNKIVKEVLKRFPILKNKFKKNSSTELRNLIRIGQAMDYFNKSSVQFLKLESPGKDVLGYQLASHYPNMKWFVSMRNLDQIITSHHNIKTWGWAEHNILTAYVCDLMFYEYLAQQRRLFIVNVDQPSKFCLENLLSFLECHQIGDRAKDFVEKWYVVNPLVNQKKKAGEDISNIRDIPKNLPTLRQRHPWLREIEERYENLWKKNH